MIVPDLRGFGESDKHLSDPVRAYSADAQARSVLGLIDELALDSPVVAGYDIGSRITQTLARTASSRPHWSGPRYRPADVDLDRLAEIYSQPGAFTASIGWYRAGSGTVARSLAETVPDPCERISVNTTILWPEHDPLFPQAWGDRVNDFFSRAVVRNLPGVGHFVPVEAPKDFASAICDVLD